MALSPEMLKEHFEKISKCKVKWTIYKVDSYKNEWCSYSLKLYIKNNDTKYVVNGILPKKDCIIDTFNIVFFEKDIKLWKDVNYILDEKYFPLDFYSGTVETNNIPYCTWNIIREQKSENNNNYNLYWANYFIFWSIILIIVSLVIILKKRKKAKK